MPETYVFAGPSIAAATVATLLPDAVVLPPVAHGDLLNLDAKPGDRVLIIDGLFLQAAPVRHREILLLLERGVTVAGSSSMGALRAAELWRFGMRGIGEVFRLYRDGVVTGDDEVAIVHGTAEEGYRAISEPLVNIRIALRAAAAAGVLPSAQADELFEVARSLPFRSRSYRTLERLGRGRVGGAGLDAFLDWVRRNAVDAKAADARELLAMAAADDPRLRPPDGDDLPIANVRTRFLESWVARHHTTEVDGHPVSDADVMAAVMLTHPDFAVEHRRRVLAAIAGTDQDDPNATDEALRLTRSRGYTASVPTDHHDRSSDGAHEQWLTEREHELDADEALTRLLVRAFGTRNHRQLTTSMLPAALANETVLADGGAFVAQAARLNENLPHPDPARPGWRRRFRDDVVDRHFAALWGCPLGDVESAAWDRGFADLDSFRAVAEPFVAHLKILGPPAYTAAHRTGGHDV